jgi:PQQ-like domain
LSVVALAAFSLVGLRACMQVRDNQREIVLLLDEQTGRTAREFPELAVVVGESALGAEVRVGRSSILVPWKKLSPDTGPLNETWTNDTGGVFTDPQQVSRRAADNQTITYRKLPVAEGCFELSSSGGSAPPWKTVSDFDRTHPIDVSRNPPQVLSSPDPVSEPSGLSSTPPPTAIPNEAQVLIAPDGSPVCPQARDVQIGTSLVAVVDSQRTITFDRRTGARFSMNDTYGSSSLVGSSMIQLWIRSFGARDARDGTLLWSESLPDSNITSRGLVAVPDGSGSVVLSSPDSTRAYDKNGRQLWSFSTHDLFNPRISITERTALISYRLGLVALDSKTGEVRWKRKFSGRRSPHVLIPQTHRTIVVQLRQVAFPAD